MPAAKPSVRLHCPTDAGPESLADFAADPLAALERLAHRHDELAAVAGETGPLFFAFGPALNQRILNHPEQFRPHAVVFPGPRRSAQRRLALCVLSASGEEYKHRRRVMLAPLMKTAVAGYAGAIRQLTADMLERWQPGEVRDMYAEIRRFVLQVTSGILFGLERPEVAFATGRLLDHWLEEDMALGRPGLIAGTKDPAAYERLLTTAEEVERRLLALAEDDRDGDSLIGRLLRVGERLPEASAAGLIGDVAFFFAAAHKTTACALTWTLLLLAQHPSVCLALQDEVQGAVEGDASDVERVGKLPLLGAVLRESMRLLPPVPYFSRHVAEATELCGRMIPARSMVFVSPFVTHRRVELFRDPARFMPERWNELHASPHEFIPFSAGPRMCPGAAFSTLNIKLALSMLLERFTLRVPRGTRIDHRVAFVLEPTPQLPMQITPAALPPQAVRIEGTLCKHVELNDELGAQRRAA